MLGEQDIRFLNLEKKTGAFIIAALIGIALVIIFIGIRQDLFTSKSTIFIVVDSGSDLNEGQAVKFKGFRVGKVQKVMLNDVAKVEVTLSINKDYMKWIKSDSRAKLVREGVVGDNIIEIVGGTPNAPQMDDKGIMPFEREMGLNEILEDLKREVTAAITDVRKIVDYINDPAGDVKVFISNLREVSDEFVETNRKLDRLITKANTGITTTLDNVDSVAASVKKEILPELSSLVDTAKQTMTVTNSVVMKIDKELPGAMESASKSLKNIELITEDIKQATPEIPAIMEESGEVIGGTKEVVDSVKGMWPINRSIKAPEKNTMKIDSAK